MRNPSETDERRLDLASLECLKRTRSGVLNVMVGAGAVVALTGLSLRGRTAGALALGGPAERTGQTLLIALFVIFVVSSVLRRVMGRRSRLRDPEWRWRRFYWGHIIPAAVGALAAPLGLAYGWLISPSFQAVFPFWVVALLLGILAYPRGRELEDFDRPMASEKT